MTYNVFSGTLKPTQSINQSFLCNFVTRILNLGWWWSEAGKVTIGMAENNDGLVLDLCLTSHAVCVVHSSASDPTDYDGL